MEGLIYDSSYCTKPRDDFVLVNKTLSATRKNLPYRSLLSEGSFKKIVFRVYFWPLPFPCIWRAKSKAAWKEVMPTEINLQLNSCQAKDKPPRHLRSERSRKADGTASSRIACQESTLWQCRQQIQFDVTLFKADSVSCLMMFEKTNAIERCTKTQPCICAKRIFIKELLINTPPKDLILSI